MSNVSSSQEYDDDRTIISLNRVHNETLVELSSLTLPEIEQLKGEIADSLPKSNLPGLILSGLTSVKSRNITRKKAEEDVNALFHGTALLREGMYQLMFGGPARVLSAYQRILELAGKDQNSAFPDGIWQFYVEFGLREDAGRHASETIAYHRSRPRNASTIDDITAWIMTAIYLLFDADNISATIWNEWTTLRLIKQYAASEKLENVAPFKTMIRDWLAARPYITMAGASYADKRRSVFEGFMKTYFDLMSEQQALSIRREVNRLAREERDAYQQQMSLLQRLEPGKFRDTRITVPLWQAKIGLIWKGHNYLFDVCMRDEFGRAMVFTTEGDTWPLEENVAGKPIDPYARALTIRGGWLYREDETGGKPIGYIAPPDINKVKGVVEQIVNSELPPSDTIADRLLIETPRSEQEHLRGLLPIPTKRAIKELSTAPIIINWDEQQRSFPLARLRREARRGVGDHPLTVMRTDTSIVFDQSHIFFDGTWGMAVAELMTNQAIDWCRHAMAADSKPGATAQRLSLISSQTFEDACKEAINIEGYSIAEAAAETTSVDLEKLNKMRQYLKQRGVGLTINDILILGRIFHAEEYIPSSHLTKLINDLPDKIRKPIMDSVEASGGINPALLIPMDASMHNPRDRIYPTSFRNPMSGMMDAYDSAKMSLGLWQVQGEFGGEQREQAWSTVEEARKQFFSYLLYYGELLEAIKAMTIRGESFNIATIKLLGHLPPQMQTLLDQIPQRFGVLNEVVKGEEVFSNVGQVAKDSSLIRFISAKDDGRAKRLVWGILTDDAGVMRVTLRDFRVHVEQLIEAGYMDLADMIARDYVETYAQTVNRLSDELRELALLEKDR